MRKRHETGAEPPFRRPRPNRRGDAPAPFFHR